MKPMEYYKDFAASLQAFFLDYLVRERGSSRHTIRAYRDTFSLLVDYMDTEHHVPPDRLSFSVLSVDKIRSFLNWLEECRGNSICTRNQRNAALRSFFKYMIYIDPIHINHWKSMGSIPMKNGPKGTLNYMSVDAVRAILEEIETGTPQGLRDLTMLSLLYNTGARVQELIDLTPLSVRRETPYVIELFGKGSKKRLVPLEDAMMNLLTKYMRIYRLDQRGRESYPLFPNRWGGKLTSQGVSYTIDKYVAMARIRNPDLLPDAITPHVFRHSRAMHLLQAGVNLVYIRDILGHVSVQTTEIYARTDSKQKREALENAYAAVGITEPDSKKWEQNPKLREMLKELCR